MDLERDPEGFLKNLNDWSEAIADEIASEDDLVLTEQHWQIINFVRDFHQEYQHVPRMRAFVNALKEKFGTEVGNSIHVQTLFPTGIRQICKVAGLPKPTHCM